MESSGSHLVSGVLSRRQVHVITPGDHFSPSTGSAIPTVVNGLCRSMPECVPHPAVVVARGTYPDRYGSAEIIEYEAAPPMRLRRPLTERRLDVAMGAAGLARWPARRRWAPTVSEQSSWEPSVVLAHNAPQLLPLVDQSRHAAVLYAHNHLLRTYGRVEAIRVIGRAAAIICVSDFLANQTAQRLPRSLRDRVRVVRNGVDADLFRRTSPIQRTGPLKVVFVGRMIPEKGADVLIGAVRRLDRDDVHLTIIGSDGFDPRLPLTPYERAVREAAMPLGDRVAVKHFLPRGQVAAEMAAADVVVVPSRWPEPFALTVLEGMAAGAAVVGSEIGGIPETLRGIGILVPPGDTAALAEAIGALADDEALLRRTAEAGARFANDHDWSRASQALLAIVAELG